MPEIELTVTPNTFTLPATDGSPGSTIWYPIQLRIPAFADPACDWWRIRSSATLDGIGGPPTTSGRLSFAGPAIGIDTISYGFVLGPVVPRRDYIYSERFETPPFAPFSTGYYLNLNKLTARTITVWFAHSQRVDTIYSDFRVWLFSVCDALPDPGDGTDGDDDDDDTPNGPGSGVYRALKADSPRGWLHVANEAAIQTKHIVPGTAAFASGTHGVKWWKQFDVDTRSGTFFALGRATGTSEVSKVFRSDDGGLTMEEVLSVTANSTVMQYDSQNKWLIVLTEAEPAAPSDPLSNGAVSVRISRNNGETFESPVTCQYAGGTLSARLLGMTYAEREGAELFLLCRIGNQTKLLSSTDGGTKWEARIA